MHINIENFTSLQDQQNPVNDVYGNKANKSTSAIAGMESMFEYHVT